MRSIPRALLVLALALPAVALVAASSIPVAAAQGDPRIEARTRYNAGKQKYDAGDYRGAIADFTAADQLAPSAVNDFNIALSYERLNEPGQAVRYYRAYLNRMPNAPNRTEVEAAVQRLDAAAKAGDADAARKAAEEARLAEEARQAEEARRAEEVRKATEGREPVGPGTEVGVGVGGGAPAYQPTGDAELDRVAAIDVNQARGGSALPPPSVQGAAPAGAGGGAAAGAGGAAAGASGPAPTPTDPPEKKPFYKSPVFWVVAAVGVYVLIVLVNDDSNQAQSGRLLLPEGPGTMQAGSGGATLLRF